jgi:hypothetical protein
MEQSPEADSRVEAILMIHELKCHPAPFAASLGEVKMFEYRRNDRDFKVTDILVLREFDPFSGYTGRMITRKVTYILKESFDLPEGYCILSVRVLTPEEEANHAAGTIPALSA